MEMDDEFKKNLIAEAFGDSSSDNDGDDDRQRQQLQGRHGEAQLVFGENPKWEQITEINGLSLCRDFLTPDQQSTLLASILREGWFNDASHNQVRPLLFAYQNHPTKEQMEAFYCVYESIRWAMRFGDLPTWAKELSTRVLELIRYSDYDPESMDTYSCKTDEKACIFPLELLNREPLFNQLIVNSYQPGEGICAHVDLMRFEDGIALVSLESPCVMHFSRVENGVATNGKQTEANIKIPVYLTPGSLLLISGEARYQWKHEINRKPGFQKWDGLEIDQKRRTSITLRKLCSGD